MNEAKLRRRQKYEVTSIFFTASAEDIQGLPQIHYQTYQIQRKKRIHRIVSNKNLTKNSAKFTIFAENMMTLVITKHTALLNR